jgi:hypothetical protein
MRFGPLIGTMLATGNIAAAYYDAPPNPADLDNYPAVVGHISVSSVAR